MTIPTIIVLSLIASAILALAVYRMLGAAKASIGFEIETAFSPAADSFAGAVSVMPKARIVAQNATLVLECMASLYEQGGEITRSIVHRQQIDIQVGKTLVPGVKIALPFRFAGPFLDQRFKTPIEFDSKWLALMSDHGSEKRLWNLRAELECDGANCEKHIILFKEDGATSQAISH